MKGQCPLNQASLDAAGLMADTKHTFHFPAQFYAAYITRSWNKKNHAGLPRTIRRILQNEWERRSAAND